MKPQEYLAEQLAQARRAFQAQLGEAALCQVSKEGRITGGLKYAEGRLVALRNLEKRLQLGEAAEQAGHAERALWQTIYGQHTAQTWRAYAQGGLDACANFLKALDQAQV
ncbi:MAG: hypothetical protein CUN49_03455 [Candidatus Thermofonsia Clade 1 bacterium]|jgi:hypothetical protein|uniref:Uncharacterized protein n=1 Tax=Candidatus Thermofonsia Clade 1 bacterium TaxID=2364210 RepID=A0A2M8PGZ3_9CHLR|nr:MAG: hypothetical protein CUN49_03455 [Candidatus Thermofonsia Clade 1 bacterium]RMF51217.1 MAG: hypothetical protein D6749_08470 [Chloroflexota bacterium]